MNETMILNWNKVVKKHDTVYHLGDFIFKVNSDLLHETRQRLHGNLIIIKGNHDSNKISILDSAVINAYGHKIKLMHSPAHADAKIKYNFCGHVHNIFKFSNRNGINLINVGVDVWNFTPVSLETILKEFNKWLIQQKMTLMQNSQAL